jgi:hypothetical protein
VHKKPRLNLGFIFSNFNYFTIQVVSHFVESEHVESTVTLVESVVDNCSESEPPQEDIKIEKIANARIAFFILTIIFIIYQIIRFCLV